MKKTQRRLLHSLDAKEVSLVDKGANLKKFLIHKASAMPNVANEVLKAMQSTDARDLAKVDAVVKAMCDKPMVEKDDGVPDEIDGMSDRAQAALKAVARILAPFKDEIHTGNVVSLLQDGVGMSDGAEGDAAMQEDGDVEDSEDVGDTSMDTDEAPEYVAMAHDEGAPGEEDEDMADGKEWEQKLGKDMYADKGGEAEKDGDNPQDHDEPGEVIKDEMEMPEDKDSMGDHHELRMGMAKPAGVADDHHAEAMGAAKKAYHGALQEKGYVKKTPGMMNKEPEQKAAEMPEDEDAVMKSYDLSAFPKQQQRQMLSIFKSHQDAALAQNKDLVQKAAVLEKQLAAERGLREEREYIAKAEELTPNMGADTRTVARVLKTLSSVDKKVAAEFEAILKSADAQHQASQAFGGNLFAERGSRLGGSGSGSAESKLNALVDSVVQKSSGEKTREKIYAEICKSPEGKKLRREIEGI